MEDQIHIHPSASQEAIEYLVDAGVGRAQAEAMIRNPEQSSNSQTSNSQSETSTLGALEERMCKMMDQRLDQLAAKIDGTSEVEGNGNSPHHQLYQTAGERDETVAEEEPLHTKGWRDEMSKTGQSHEVQRL